MPPGIHNHDRTFIQKFKLCFSVQIPHVISAYGSVSHSHLQTGLFEHNQPSYLRSLQEIYTEPNKILERTQHLECSQ